MKKTTLALIIRENNGKRQVLLGEKKKGEIGTGVLSGPGGKNEYGESDEDCLIRETFEETGISLDPSGLEKVAIITFYAGIEPHNRCQIFLARKFRGELVETADMLKPEWYDTDNLPFNRMFESDREWFAKAVSGEKLRANAYYHALAKDFDRIEFFPFE